MNAIFDRYFTITDTAVTDGNLVRELVALFAPDAVVSTGESETYRGSTQIEGFFATLVGRNMTLHHAWTPEHTSGDGSVSTRWGVVGLRKTGEIFTAQGTDVARVD